VLSGFIFFQKYGKPVTEHSLSLKKYCVLRFSRLYPLHWLTLLVFTFFVLFRRFNDLSYFPYDGAFKYTPFLFLLNIPLVQYGWVCSTYSFNVSSWSLSVEIMMYLLFFALAYFSRSTRRIFLGSIVFAVAGIFLGILRQAGFDFPIVYASRGFSDFFIGCITAGIYNYCNENRPMRRVFTAVSIGFILLSLFLSFAVFFLPLFSVFLAYGGMGYWVVAYSFLLFPALIFLSLQFKFPARIFSIKPLLYLGRISFSIYLIHFPMVLVITTVDEYFNLSIDYSTKLAFFTYMALVLLFSHLSYFYFETPVQAWIRKKLIFSSSGR
jgi:peptidoglycan/LPS O-acetylase OafA/YrhL